MWVLAAAVVAMLPLRRQFLPGGFLIIAAPVILIWIGYDHGLWITLAGLAAVLSMFRKPLRYYALRALGRAPELPAELREVRGLTQPRDGAEGGA
ncbi:DUF2484 family protein [Aquicoccus sp. G2-2]|uniref:DUF2484 family protein n=1 Tax=Aquicoccus sp. G2-2 TaxID=3092120 RepID=UPI002ADFA382|nr:DUF2484 family protein [Aquicoccus sp. G2-2]MEA1113591.1 DUF2484 family protein [Aquicoccus sp. G2-2]